ncbi:Ubiquitin carboxyl-terminal hydrolase 48 [Terramyces sp. JEL0728]|nr:Ubiquitin carboxyl-terminal hydrolase 48 [Terramyces sp. JEL0728]
MQAWDLVCELYTKGIKDPSLLYKIQHDKCKAKCAGNPNCLKSLEFHIDNTIDKIELRSNPAGLRNYGATCYLNSLLQIWFNNLKFRMEILSCSKNNEILRSIQQIFANLLLTNRKYYEPAKFIELMKLEKGVQQDCLEFSKLLLSRLPVSGNIFQGEIEYETRCLKCNTCYFKSTLFHELQLGIKPSIMECIKEYFSSAELTNDNKYLCQTCNAKQNATRTPKLTLLPQYLNLEINRFVYNMATLTREKLNTSIKFAQELDLSSLCQKDAAVYELVSILLHKGNTAHSGHYITKNKVNDCWYVFDDENVYLDLNFEKELQSDSVYSLVYRKKGSPESSEEACIQPMSPSLKEEVLADNQEFLAFMNSSNLEIQQKNDENSRVVELLEQLFQVWEPKTEGCFVSFDSLNDVMKGLKAAMLNGAGAEPGDNAGSSDNPIVIDKDIDSVQEVVIIEGFAEPITVHEPKSTTIAREVGDLDIKCKHSRLDPSKIPNTKRISREGLDTLGKLNITVNSFSEDDICMECFDALVKSKLQDYIHGIDYTKMKSLPKQSGVRYFVSSEWYNEWKKRTPKFENGVIPSPLSSPYSEHIYCSHGNRLPEAIKFTAIAQNVYNIIKTRYKVTLPSNELEPCNLCNVKDFKERVEDEQKHLRRLLKSKSTFIQNETYYLLPTPFLVEWRRFIKSKSNPANFLDTTNLLCQHELSLYLPTDNHNFSEFIYVTADEWEYLLSKYPLIGKPIMLLTQETDPKICIECRLDRLLDYKTAIINIYKRGGDDTPVKKGTKTRGGAMKKKNLRLDIDAFTTVQDLKEELAAYYKVPAYYQTLFFKGRELESNETMKGIKILPEELIEVEIFEPDEELLYQQEAELGFYGTALG